MYVGSKTVAAAGTPEALATDSDISPSTWSATSTIIRGKQANTGVVYVLGSGSNKWPEDDGLAAGESVTLPVDPRQVRVDVSVSGEGVDWLAA